MKKIITMMAIVLILLVFPVSVLAEASDMQDIYVVCYDDGSTLTIEVTDCMMRGAVIPKTGQKTYTYRNSEGTAQWKAVLTGNFTCTGSSATCTASSCDVTIFNTNWRVVSKTTTRDGNVARANLTMELRYLGVTTNSKSISMKLTCDGQGNLS